MEKILYSRNRQELLYNIIIFFIYVVLLTFVMRFLWNTILVKKIDILRPVDTLTDTFLLALGIAMFRL
jgi:uncharacterized membrane protein SirB2